MSLPDAIVLVGPTGSGKTPLGAELRARGLWGGRCVHFDFGEEIRRLVAGGRRAAFLRPADVDVLRRSLARGTLLEEEHFPIAEGVLRAFLRRHRPGEGGRVVLNGLPRHAGQAEALRGLVRVRAVVELACDARTVAARIRDDAGGDRAGRQDDEEQAVRRKLGIYARRTSPLVEYYRRQGAAVVTISVGPRTTAAQCRDALEQRHVER